jgi:hypothetical protein
MVGYLHHQNLKKHDQESLTARRDGIKKIIEDVVVQ